MIVEANRLRKKKIELALVGWCRNDFPFSGSTPDRVRKDSHDAYQEGSLLMLDVRPTSFLQWGEHQDTKSKRQILPKKKEKKKQSELYSITHHSINPRPDI